MERSGIELGPGLNEKRQTPPPSPTKVFEWNGVPGRATEVG